MLEEEVTLNRT
jgi:senataxin